MSVSRVDISFPYQQKVQKKALDNTEDSNHAPKSDTSKPLDSWKGEAKESDDYSSILAFARSHPSLREERIADIRSKIEGNFYNTDSFAEELAGKLI